MRKKIYLYALVLACFASCKKNEIKIRSLATISLLNAVIDGKVAKLNTHLRDSSLTMDYKHFVILAEDNSQIRVYPSGSSGATYFNQSLNTNAGDIYSLFLTGTHTNPESVLIKENIPPYPTEEVINVRLINLAPNSSPLSLTLGDQPTVSIFSNVFYKQATEFRTLTFPTTLPNGRNLFQIRDGLGALLSTYEMPDFGKVSTTSSRKRNITIAVKGTLSGTGDNAFGILVLPHY